MSARPKWVMSCMEPGPMFYDGDEPIETSCTRNDKHRFNHEFWSDDGEIRLSWYDGWTLGPADWRDAGSQP